MNQFDEFEKWLGEQPYWIQDAAWRLFNKKLIDDAQIDKYVQMCLEQSQNHSVSYNQISNDTLEEKAKPIVSIRSIYDIKAVNALAENTQLSFGDKGLSVIYGLNGAGKTGFMRIFKHVSEHPYAEPIQQNVFKKSRTGKPFCKFDISVGEDEQTLGVDLTKKCNDSYLCQCDVFDTRISNAYVTNSNSVSYEPFVFTVLKELASIAEKISLAIREKINLLPPLSLEYPDYISGYQEASWTISMSEKTIVPEECLCWEESDAQKINELSNMLNTEQVQKTINAKRYQLTQINKISDELKQIEERITIRYRENLKAKHRELQKAKDQYDLSCRLFSENATDQDKLSINIDDWKTLWKVGRSYYEKAIHNLDGKEFAKPGSICPLCLQSIEGDTLKRFSSVDEYINGEFSTAYDTAKNEYLDTFAAAIMHTYTSFQVADSLQEAVPKGLVDRIVSFYQKLDRWSQKLIEEEVYREIISIDSLPFAFELSESVEKLRTEIESLETVLDAETRESLMKERTHLLYRQWVFQNLSLINAIISQEKDRRIYQQGLQLTRTNKITSESNHLAEALITDAYIQRFEKEMKILAPRLKVKLEKVQSKKGRSPYKVVLDSEDVLRKKPEEILSEGEQRIVALAAFFADATGRTEKTPIIIDDPISSLDYHYEDAASERIVELAKERQVIVFTHRISLLIGLEEKSNQKDVPFCDRFIRGTINGTGVPDFENVYHGKISEQLDGIKKEIYEIKKKDPDSMEYREACGYVSQQLRICIERSVEDVLFQRIVKRFSRRIMVNNIMKIERISSEDCEMIDSMMSRYSYDEHSQPEDCPLIERDLDDVITDIDDFQKWIKGYNKKMR